MSKLKTSLTELLIISLFFTGIINADNHVTVLKETGDKTILKKDLKVGKNKRGKKAIFFLGKGKSRSRRMALMQAKMSTFSKIALALNGVFKKQIMKIRKLKNNTVIRKKIIRQFNKAKIKIRGAMLEKTYIRYIKIRNRKFYEVNVLMTIPYKKYVEKRMKFLKKYFKSMANRNDKRFYKSIKSALLRLDRQPDAGIN